MNTSKLEKGQFVAFADPSLNDLAKKILSPKAFKSLTLENVSIIDDRECIENYEKAMRKARELLDEQELMLSLAKLMLRTNTGLVYSDE